MQPIFQISISGTKTENTLTHTHIQNNKTIINGGGTILSTGTDSCQFTVYVYYN